MLDYLWEWKPGKEDVKRGKQNHIKPLVDQTKLQVCGLLNYLREWIPVEEDVKRGKGYSIKPLVDQRKKR